MAFSPPRLLILLLCCFLYHGNVAVVAVTDPAGDADNRAANRCCLRDAAVTPIALSKRKPKRMAFIIGAQKSGTTFLFDELVARHPNIMSRTVKGARKEAINSEKEAQYFNMLPLPDAREYIKAFANSGDPLNSSITFIDGTPDYLHTPSSACRIAGAFPDAKLVVLLRDPVARALSHWNMWRVFGGKRSFSEEVYDELSIMRSRKCSFEPPGTLSGNASSSGRALQQLISPEPDSTWRRSPGMPSWNSCFRCSFGRCGTLVKTPDNSGRCMSIYPQQGIVRRGLYVYQLEWWLRLFPQKQMIILHHKQLQRDPETVIDRVITFLEQDPKLKQPPTPVGPTGNLIFGKGSSVKAGFQAKNVSGWSLPLREKNATEVYAEAIADLYRFYAHANEELYALLDTLEAASGWIGRFPTSMEKSLFKKPRLSEDE